MTGRKDRAMRSSIGVCNHCCSSGTMESFTVVLATAMTSLSRSNNTAVE